jgi:hypothetical protein
MDLKDDPKPARFRRLTCHTTFKEYVLRCPPETKTIKEALKWAYRPAWMSDEEFEKWEYAPVVET